MKNNNITYILTFIYILNIYIFLILVLRKRGKLISFLRMFFTNRPARNTLKRTGIVKERVFGCDLGEHLLNSGHDGKIFAFFHQ